jgi:hypothetical protein
MSQRVPGAQLLSQFREGRIDAREHRRLSKLQKYPFRLRQMLNRESRLLFCLIQQTELVPVV